MKTFKRYQGPKLKKIYQTSHDDPDVFFSGRKKTQPSVTFSSKKGSIDASDPIVAHVG